MNLRFFSRLGFSSYVLKTALSAGLAWLAASWVSHNQYPYFAALGAILTVQVTVVDSINKAVQRVAGIIGGVVVSVIVGYFMALNALSIALVVFLGMAISTALRLNSAIITQVAVSSLLVLAFGMTHGYAVDRIIETVIGCAIAVIFNIAFVPPNPIPDAEKRILHLSDYACTVLNNLAAAFQIKALRPVDMPYVQELVNETEKSYQAVRLAAQSLRYSPFMRSKRAEVLALSTVIKRFEHITIQIRGIARALVDLGPESDPTEEFIEAMQSTAVCIGLFAQTEIDPTAAHADALRSAIGAAQLRQTQCLLHIRDIESLRKLTNVGSILTDLGRILDEISGKAAFISERQ